MEKLLNLLHTLLVLILMFFGGGDSETLPPTLSADQGIALHFIDVGQADSTLIVCDGEAMLIDGGNVEDSSLIYSYLSAQGIDELRYAVVTHGHEDHVGGMSGALHYAEAETVLCPVTEYDSAAFRNFLKTLQQQNVAITVPEIGDTYTLGAAQFEILHCDPSDSNPNNTGIVLRITHGETAFLFTGDAETEVEDTILEAGFDISCDLLKVGHHGSDTSTGYRWLYEAWPEYAVIPVGKDNSYGHPTEEVLSRLENADVEIYRTDVHGTIVCTGDGKKLTFTTEY